jgi:hypothetical protein
MRFTVDASMNFHEHKNRTCFAATNELQNIAKQTLQTHETLTFTKGRSQFHSCFL